MCARSHMASCLWSKQVLEFTEDTEKMMTTSVRNINVLTAEHLRSSVIVYNFVTHSMSMLLCSNIWIVFVVVGCLLILSLLCLLYLADLEIGNYNQ